MNRFLQYTSINYAQDYVLSSHNHLNMDFNAFPIEFPKICP